MSSCSVIPHLDVLSTLVKELTVASCVSDCIKYKQTKVNSYTLNSPATAGSLVV